MQLKSKRKRQKRKPDRMNALSRALIRFYVWCPNKQQRVTGAQGGSIQKLQLIFFTSKIMTPQEREKERGS